MRSTIARAFDLDVRARPCGSKTFVHRFRLPVLTQKNETLLKPVERPTVFCVASEILSVHSFGLLSTTSLEEQGAQRVL